MFRRSSSKSGAKEADIPVIKQVVAPVPATVPSTPARSEPVAPPRPEPVRSEVGRCPHHRNKVLDLYCKVHKELICSNCTVTRHHECHKHPSLHVGEESVSPFQPVEDAALELRGLVDGVLAQEKIKEDTIRQAVKKLESTGEGIKSQVASLSVELESVRSRLVQEVNSWCEVHLHRLDTVGDNKQEILARQEEQLQAKIDALIAHQRNTLGAIKDSKALSDLVPLCLRLLEKVSPIPELTFAELEPADKANIVFLQTGKQGLLEDIRTFGYTGAAEQAVESPKLQTPKQESPVEYGADADLFSFN